MFIKMQVFNEQTYKYNKKYILFMKFIKQFATDELMNEAALQIHHKDEFTYLYKSNNSASMSFIDQRHPGPNCLMLSSVNMSPVKLDASSSKKKPAVADVLYSTKDGKLTLDAQTNSVDNTPIAICVIPEVMENFKNGDDSIGAVKTAKFVSLNYMNYNKPATGSDNTQDMYFGNNDTRIGNVKGGTGKTSYIGGKWDTQQCLSKATNQDKHICDGVTNNSGTGYSPAACCCVAYSTLGTKPGDWYLPLPGELYQIHANKKAIDEKRKAIKGSGFSEYYNYCSSRGHYQNDCEYSVDLNTGIINIDIKDNRFFVLGFLALEVPQGE